MLSFQNLADWCKGLVFPGKRVSNDDALGDALRPEYRWPIRRDIPQLVDLDQRVAVQPWDATDFIAHLARHDCLGRVATLQRSDAIVGAILYAFCKNHYEVVKLMVHPDFMEFGIANHLLEYLQLKLLSPGDRWRIDALVDERELLIHQHFRAAGFTAVDVFKDHFTGSHGTSDGYLFTFTADEAKARFADRVRPMPWWRGFVGKSRI